IPLSDRTCTLNASGSDASGGQNCEFTYTVALSRDSRTAYVSSWGKNYVTTVDTSTRKVTGRITVGTHPSALAVNPARDEIYVANAKGLGAGPNPGYTQDSTNPDQYLGSMIKGTLSTIAMPDQRQLRDYTRRVQVNDGFDDRDLAAARDAQHVVPRTFGGPS